MCCLFLLQFCRELEKALEVLKEAHEFNKVCIASYEFFLFITIIISLVV